MSGGPITWRSSRQKLVALSSCESELIAITDAVKDTLWLREALQDLDVDLEGATTIFEDNQGVIAISANNRGKSQRTKHISTRYFCIQSYVSDGHVSVVYCPTDEMIADIFTKPLGATVFVRPRVQLGINPV